MRVLVNGKRVSSLSGKKLRRGQERARAFRVPVTLAGRNVGRQRVQIVARTTRGRTIRLNRAYRTCMKKQQALSRRASRRYSPLRASSRIRRADGHQLGVAGLGDLHRRGRHLRDRVAQVGEAVGHPAAGLLPRDAEALAVLLDVGAPGVGKREGLALLALGGRDQPLVLELRERGVDRAGARAPGALAALLDLLA